MTHSKKALLIGASGLIGSHCLQALLDDVYFTQIEVWVRKPLAIKHLKLKCIIRDLGDISQIPATDATHVFCCLGTTIKKAGTQAAFRKVDFDYVVEMAKLAERSHVTNFTLISSIGANPQSGNFYLCVKGQMEEAVKSCSIHSIIILRPSMLLGKRQEFRIGEEVGKALMHALNFLFVGKLRKYRGIQASAVAKEMIELAKESSAGIRVVESDKIRKWQ